MFHMKVAEHIYTIENRYGYLPALCKDYVCEDEGVHIAISDEELEHENQTGENWSPAYLESLAVYRKICEQLLEEDILLFHCSALQVGEKAVLFTAPSGTGKSTHARLWRERFGDKVLSVNDDKPLLSFTENEIRVWGTPYCGKEGIQSNTSAPVAAVVILHQEPENELKKLTAVEAFPTLFCQSYRRPDTPGMQHTMALVAKLCELPCYSLGCTISQEAVSLVYDTLTKDGVLDEI